jgi:hypothetical protein
MTQSFRGVGFVYLRRRTKTWLRSFGAGKNAKGDVIELLVREGGCNGDVVDHMQLRPINKALYYDRDPSIVQALIRCGARVGF